MVSLQHLSLIIGSTSATVLMAWPVQANDAATTQVRMADATVTPATPLATAGATPVMATGQAMDDAWELRPTGVGDAPGPVSTTAAEPVTPTATLEDYLTDAAPLATDPFAITADPRLEETADREGTATVEAAAVLAPEAIADFPADDTPELAQVRGAPAAGVAPFYVGVGGNIGIIDTDESAVGDFAFNVISKFSLGPQFALRPMLQFSEDDFSVALPVTFNFNPSDFGRFTVYPSLGAGIDISDEVALLVNGGIDVPISPSFTFNSQLNWRVTGDTGLGLSVGVGYNFSNFLE